MRRIVSGSVVLRSTMVDWEAAAGRMPASPVQTDSTSRGRGSEVNISSLAFATSPGVSAQDAPSDSSYPAESFRRSETVSWWPPASRLRAIQRPMSPMPINPIFIVSSHLFYLWSPLQPISSVAVWMAPPLVEFSLCAEQSNGLSEGVNGRGQVGVVVDGRHGRARPSLDVDAVK